MPSYIITSSLDMYYSDKGGANFLVAPEFGLDPKNPSNVNYTTYNKPYNQFQWLGGINLKLAANTVAISAGDQLDYVIYNTATNNVLTRFVYSMTFQNYGNGVPQEAMIVVGMPALSLLGVGILEGFGSLRTSNTVYVFDSTFRTLTLP